MSTHDREEVMALLERIDLDKLTIGEVRRVSNPALQLVLAELIREAIRVKPEHTSHGSHTDHLKDTIIDRPIIDRPIVDVAATGATAVKPDH
jgi:hypothetical protein